MRELLSVLIGIGLFFGVMQHLDGSAVEVLLASLFAMFAGGLVTNALMARFTGAHI